MCSRNDRLRNGKAKLRRYISQHKPGNGRKLLPLPKGGWLDGACRFCVSAVQPVDCRVSIREWRVRDRYHSKRNLAEHEGWIDDRA